MLDLRAIKEEDCMPVITIRGQMGGGAPEIGKLIADTLHVDYIDRQIISEVAKKLRVSKGGVTEKETPPGSLWERIALALSRGYPAGSGYAGAMGTFGADLPVYEMPLGDSQYLAGLESVIKGLAESDAVVIRGRGSQFILKAKTDALHVLVVAPEELRIKRIIESLKMQESDAKKEISRSDSSHREFIKRYFQADLEDPVNYDIVVNTAVLEFEDIADIAIKTLHSKQKAAKKLLNK
jgi:cytidylate kinase